jgi:hypothetical protein
MALLLLGIAELLDVLILALVMANILHCLHVKQPVLLHRLGTVIQIHLDVLILALEMVNILL